MIAEVDDPDVYHQDFTTASSWEEFIDRIEKIIVKWKLNEPTTRKPLKKGDLEGEWEKKIEEFYYEGMYLCERILLYWWSLKDDETLNAGDIDAAVSHTPQSLVDMMSIAGDFVTASSCPRVAHLYGIREFILLKADKSKFSSETKPLSCLTIALNATGCEIPAFVQLLEDWQHFYLGSCIGKEVIADYEMVHLERTPQHCKYLTGLLDTFKSKISRGQQLPSIELAVRLTYSLKMLNPLQNFNVLTSNKGGMLNLPFGLASDPINKLHLLATWPQLTDQMVVDSQSYSDLEPMQAHIWSVQIELTENLRAPKLSLCLSSLCKMALEPHVPFTVEFSKKFIQSLDALTESKVPTISKVFDRVLTGSTVSGVPSRKKQGAIPTSKLKEYLYFLFPDADPISTEPYESFEAQQDSSKTSETGQFPKCLDGVKSSPPEGLVWRLALLLPLIYAKDGVASAAHMWFEFTEEMRFRWEQAIPVPG
ncbi:Rab3 GTPase-activating protein catalytic subunit [Frankliniella fusca]|uniref:Rab3 GTPase-activating protein catalytic subunit n=1 Tax=Frankliniella fusca TaxID=407009 RepID=A0AAE1L536_9NEOP|nr:Rab3 GTPase-activating protein catalytic subunit [Frankliniella fusca]